MNPPEYAPSGAAKSFRPGIYEHFKGKRYKAYGVVRHSETLEEMILYQHLYGDFSFWVRPIGMFLEDVTRDGEKMPRFKYIEESHGF